MHLTSIAARAPHTDSANVDLSWLALNLPPIVKARLETMPDGVIDARINRRSIMVDEAREALEDHNDDLSPAQAVTAYLNDITPKHIGDVYHQMIAGTMILTAHGDLDSETPDGYTVVEYISALDLFDAPITDAEFALAQSYTK